MHVHVEAIEGFEMLCVVLIFLADQRCTRVGGVDMDPDIWVVLQDVLYLAESICSASRGSPHSRGEIERFQTLPLALLEHGLQPSPCHRHIIVQVGSYRLAAHSRNQSPFRGAAMALITAQCDQSASYFCFLSLFLFTFKSFACNL